ncbi:MAG: aminopeptidase P family protein [Bdellovibrionales bacterium]|nr:aminopeptidase P family protein [Oligoflexia bacterium]
MTLDPNACFVFFGASEVVRNYDTHFSFKQESTFHYLTDFDEPDAILVLIAGESHLFVLEKDEAREIWNGDRYGVEKAKSVFKVEHTHLVQSFYEKFTELLTDANKVYYGLGDNLDRDRRILQCLHQARRFQGQGRFGHLPVFDPLPFVTELRIIKDDFEIAQLRKATSATAKAHLQVMKRAKAGMTEFDALNEFQYHLYKSGCTDQGYTPIFASGLNATTLHYVRNNEMLKHGDMLLVDAGGEVNGYTADLTQTFPISGKFSPVQKTVYEKVLEVNREITKLAKPGTTYRALHTQSVHMLTDALLSMGVLSGTRDENIESLAYRKYYPHGLSHYLGLDVHDVGAYRERGQDFVLKPGMLMTNEPGLYFRERGNPYYGIGVRIEDDLLITETGAENLTHELPRDIEAIENLRMTASS